MKPELQAKLDLYRDEPSNVIVFKGLDQLKQMLRDPSYRPKPIPTGRVREFRTK